MAYTLVGAPWNQSLSDDGVPVSGGFIYIYASGTSTPANSYSDSAGVTPNSNPVELDAAGRPESGAIYLPSGGYKLVLTDADATLIRTQDNYVVVDPS